MNNYNEDFLHIDGVFGIIKDDADTSIGEHTHDFLELKYITSGTAKEYIDGVPYDVEKGSMIFLNYGQVHSFESDGIFSYINFMLKPEFISNMLISNDNYFDLLSLSIFGEFKDESFTYTPVVNFRGSELITIERLIENMLIEYNSCKTGYRAVLGGSMKIVFAMFIREMCILGCDNVMSHIKKLTPDILKYIDDNCFERLSIKQLAEKCFYNPAYFSRMFKKCYDMDLKTYINEKRINMAVHLLETTDKSVETVCHEVGFSDKKHFYKVFKQITRNMPSEIRK